jgi:glutamate synthase domain-containing protein 2
MNKLRYLFFTILCIFTSSCTIYTEKQSEALSKVVYASKDSMEAARIDLADKYVTETTRLVRPPKNRIKIESIYQKSVQQHIETIGSSSKHDPIPVNKQRMVIIPEKYRSDTVVVVSTEEYQRLLKDKETFAQIQRDNDGLYEAKELVDNELIRQMENRDKMINDLNIMQKKLVEKDLAILRRNIIIVMLLGAIGGATYLRIKGIL